MGGCMFTWHALRGNHNQKFNLSLGRCYQQKLCSQLIQGKGGARAKLPLPNKLNQACKLHLDQR